MGACFSSEGYAAAKGRAKDRYTEAYVQRYKKMDLPEECAKVLKSHKATSRLCKLSVVPVERWAAKPRYVGLPGLRKFVESSCNRTAELDLLADMQKRVTAGCALGSKFQRTMPATYSTALNLAEAHAATVVAMRGKVRAAQKAAANAKSARERKEAAKRKADLAAEKKPGSKAAMAGPTPQDLQLAVEEEKAAEANIGVVANEVVEAAATAKAEIARTLDRAFEGVLSALVAYAQHAEKTARFGPFEDVHDDEEAELEVTVEAESPAADGGENNSGAANKMSRSQTPGYENKTMRQRAAMWAGRTNKHLASRKSKTGKVATYLKMKGMTDQAPLVALTKELVRQHSVIKKVLFFMEGFCASESSGPVPKLVRLHELQAAIDELHTEGSCGQLPVDTVARLLDVAGARDEYMPKVKTAVCTPLEALLLNRVEPAVLASLDLRYEFAVLKVAEIYHSKIAADPAKEPKAKAAVEAAQVQVLRTVTALRTHLCLAEETEVPPSRDVTTGSALVLAEAVTAGANGVVQDLAEALEALQAFQADFFASVVHACGGESLPADKAQKALRSKSEAREAEHEAEAARARAIALEREDSQREAEEARREADRKQREVERKQRAAAAAAAAAQVEQAKLAHQESLREEEEAARARSLQRERAAKEREAAEVADEVDQIEAELEAEAAADGGGGGSADEVEEIDLEGVELESDDEVAPPPPPRRAGRPSPGPRAPRPSPPATTAEEEPIPSSESPTQQRGVYYESSQL